MNIDLGNNENYPVSLSVIPTEVQSLVLKAALFEYDLALKNWNLLKNHLNIADLDINKINGTLLSQLYDKLDIASTRLLPMVYKNLRCLDDPLLQSIKSIYLYTWARNKYYFNCAKELEKICVENNTHIILLKGLSIAFYYADDPAIRIMDDIDILIAPEKINKFLDILEKKYSKKDAYKLKRFLGILHSATFQMEKLEIDIHWQLSFKHNKLDAYARENYIIPLNNSTMNTLNPTYSFLHSIVHGITRNAIPTIRWISDCCIIAKQSQIDWELLLQEAEKLKCLDQFYVACEILPEYGINIPEFFTNYIKLELPEIQQQFRDQLKLEEHIIFMRESNLNLPPIRKYIHRVENNIKLFFLYNKAFGSSWLDMIKTLPAFGVSKIFKLQGNKFYSSYMFL